MFNAIGLQNVGVDGFIDKKLPYLHNFDVPVIVNICGEQVEEYLEIYSYSILPRYWRALTKRQFFPVRSFAMPLSSSR